MNRRDTLLALLALGIAPLAVRAQETKKIPRIGVLFISNPEPFKSEFLAGLRALGYAEGRNIQIEYRSADGKPDRLAPLAAELVRLKVDVFVAASTPAVQAAKEATKEIPIVMSSGDPVATGLIASLARPGGNITGVSSMTAELGGKLLQLVRELRPSTKQVAVLTNVTDPFTKVFLEQYQSAGKSLGIATPSFPVREVEEFKSAFAEMARRRVDAVIVQPSLPRKPVLDLVMKHRLLSASPNAPFVNEGGLLSYSARLEDQYRAVAGYVDKVLKGARPADLPVEQPTRYELVVNARTAKALGVTIPPSLLLRADRVIE